MKKCFPFLLALLLCLTACSGKKESPAAKCSCETPEDRIFALVTELYTVPDDFHKENFQDYLAADGPESEGRAIAARLNHNKTRFHEEDFAQDALEGNTRRFAEKDVYLEPYLLPQGASVRCNSVETYPVVEPGCKAFSAEVILTDEDGSETAYRVGGWAGFDEDGKFGWLEITSDSGLGKGLGAAHYPGDNVIDTHGGPTPGPSVTPAP